MDNTKMRDHLASTIFFQFGRNIRQIRQICQLIQIFKIPRLPIIPLKQYTRNIRGFSKPFAKGLANKVCQQQFGMDFLIYQLIRVPVISVRYFCLIKDVLCNFCMVSQIKSNVYLL